MSLDPAVDVVWRPLCDCTDRGEADEPSPGPDPGLCALCGDRIRAEWTPLVTTEQENPTMNRSHHPTPGRDPEEIFEEARRRLSEGVEADAASTSRRDPVGRLAGGATLVVILLFLALVASLLLWGILTVWEAM